MTILLILLHVTVCIFLIMVVLLQTGKGADLAGAFGGGGSQTAFGARGATTLLHKLTTGSAVLFMATSLTLAIISTRPSGSVVQEPGADATAATPATDEATTPPAEETPAAPAPPAAAAEDSGESDSKPADSSTPVDQGTQDEPGAGQNE